MSSTYTIAGVTFTFNTGADGMVTSIQTPTIPVGPFNLQSYVLNFDPALTLAAAEQVADGIVGLLGLS